MTLCRMMVAVHELHELPEYLFNCTDPDQEGIRPLFDAVIRFRLLGRQYEIPLDLYNV